MRMLAETLPEKTLFTPGPVMTPEEVKATVSAPDIGHRRPEFERILDTVRDQLLDVYRADDAYTTVVVSGSGTAANETVLSSLTDIRALVVTNGEFGERLAHMMKTHGIPFDTIEYEWGEYPDPADIDATLAKNPDIDLVAMTYQETSSGMINPVPEVGDLCAEHDAYLFADSISAVGGEEIDVCQENIAIATGVSNKAVAGLTGSSFICIHDDVLEQFSLDSQTVYLDLQKHIRYADKYSQTPNTPAVTSILGLNAALHVLLEKEGLGNRIDRYAKCSRYLRDRVQDMDKVQLFLPREHSSNTVTSILLPDAIDLDEFIEALNERGYLVYPGKGPFYEQGMFQVATMGEIYPRDCREFIDAFEATVANFMS